MELAHDLASTPAVDAGDAGNRPARSGLIAGLLHQLFLLQILLRIIEIKSNGNSMHQIGRTMCESVAILAQALGQLDEIAASRSV